MFPSLLNRCSYIFACVPTRIGSIIVGTFILSLLFFEVLLISSLIPFWSSGGLLIGLDERYHPITPDYGSDGLFSYTRSLCYLNLNDSVLWMAMRIPYVSDCLILTDFNKIWTQGHDLIPYWKPLVIFWCIAAISTFIAGLTLIKYKSKLFCGMAAIAHIVALLTTLVSLVLYCVSIYFLFIKYMEDIPPRYLNVGFIMLHSMAAIGFIYFPIGFSIRAYRYRLVDYELID